MAEDAPKPPVKAEADITPATPAATPKAAPSAAERKREATAAKARQTKATAEREAARIREAAQAEASAIREAAQAEADAVKQAAEAEARETRKAVEAEARRTAKANDAEAQRAAERLRTAEREASEIRAAAQAEADQIVEEARRSATPNLQALAQEQLRVLLETYEQGARTFSVLYREAGQLAGQLGRSATFGLVPFDGGQAVDGQAELIRETAEATASATREALSLQRHRAPAREVPPPGGTSGATGRAGPRPA
jgi:hypothetical protein